MSERPKYKQLVVTGVDKENGVLTFASPADRDAYTSDAVTDLDHYEFGPWLSARSVPTLWQRIRGAWFGMLDGWRYGDG